MADSITILVASAISDLAYGEFVLSQTGELTTKFTKEAIAKMEQLRQLIEGSVPNSAIAKAQAGEQGGIDDVTEFLSEAMSDQKFADQLQSIAREINEGRIENIRVGVMLVHGIGEQCQFEHLEEVVRNITADLQADPYLRSTQVSVKVSKDAAYGAKHQTWKGEGVSTATIEIIDILNKITQLEFKEVWWADIDEPNSIRAFVDFWLWGLSLWSKPPYDNLQAGLTENDMRLPGRASDENEKSLLPEPNKSMQAWHRVYLFIVSFVMLLLLPLLWALGRALRSILGLDIRPDILVEYLGDVKLYQQDKRAGKKMLTDLGEHPPRVSIRKRIISAYVEMALQNYDRWYVLSHSLGTVPAFNGLMETQQSLPNYLEKELWAKWREQRPDNFRSAKNSVSDENKENMLPQRPIWLKNDEIVDRSKLFSNLKGFVTYGSPLSKFAVLWPSIVPINRDLSVFRKDFEWINIFDPTDPVADFTRFFSSNNTTGVLVPREISYKAENVFLLSHGEYLTFNPKRKKPLIRQVSRWLHGGSNFQSLEEKDDWGWPIPQENNQDSLVVSVYFRLGIFIWFLLGLLVSLVLSLLVPRVLGQTLTSLAQSTTGILNTSLLKLNEFLTQPYFYIVATAIIVGIVGGIVRFIGFNRNRISLRKSS
jgi:virulence-associated protein VagC